MKPADLTRGALRLALVGITAGIVAYVAASLAVDGEVAGRLAASVTIMSAALVAAGASRSAARAGGADARAWNLMSLALVLFAVCAVAFEAAATMDLSEGWLTAASLVGLGFRLLLAVAVLAFPLAVATNRSMWRARLELVVTATIVAYLAWGWVVAGLFHDARHSAPAGRAALFSLLDLVLVTIVIASSLRRPLSTRDSASLVGAGLLGLVVTDWAMGAALSLEPAATAVAGTAGTAAPTTSLDVVAGLSSFLAFSLIACGAWLAAGQRSEVAATAPSSPFRDRLPILLGGIGLLATLAWRARLSDDFVLLALGIASGLELLAWQLAVLLENDEMVRKLATQSERLTTLVETAPVAIVETDQEGRVLLANSEATRLTGLVAGQRVGEHLTVVMDEMAMVDGETARDLLARGLTVRDRPVTIQRADGEEIAMLVSAAMVGDREGAVLVGSDDGPRLRGLAALIDVQRMEAFEQMASGIAHDFNNRLTVVLGAADILLAQSVVEDDRDLLESILSAGRRAASLVDQLVRYTRRQVDDPEWFDLNDVILELSAELARRSGPQIVLDFDLDDEPLPVHSDWSDLQQTVINLVANACEASSPGGTVRVATRLVVAGRGAGEGGSPVTSFAELRVEDQGSGMDEQVRARMFEPFFTTRPGAGRTRGLGLASVQGVVLRSQGLLAVESGPGVGTSISVRLPVRVAPPPAPVSPVAAPRSAVAAPSGSGVVLLVDDEPEVRSVSRRTLTDAGYAVIEAGSADDALAALDRTDLDVILLLTDVVMPGRNGVQLGHDFVARCPGRPVVLMSGFVGDSGALADQGESPFPLLAKPVSRADLLAAVADALESPVTSPSSARRVETLEP